MVGHVLDLAPGERRELLSLLTQERADLQTDDEILVELSDALRRQLSLGAATDLAEGFRRRMIRIAEELAGKDHGPGHYDFLSDRTIAEDVLEQVRLRAKALSSGAEYDFMVDFAKSFRTMSQDKRATWLREAALAASAAEPGEAAAKRAADAAKRKSSAYETAARIATDVANSGDAYRVARDAVAGAPKAAAALGTRVPTLGAAAAPLGLVAGGAVAFAIRQRRQQRARNTDAVQVRRERQATQAVVTTCAYVLAALDINSHEHVRT